MNADAKFEERVLDHLWSFHARRVVDVAADLAFALPSARSAAARSLLADLLKAMLDRGAPQVTVTELQARGYLDRIVRMPRGGRPYEATSFRAFGFEDLAQQSWETSDLRADLQRILFVTFYAPDNRVPYQRYEVGHDFFWTPSEAQWSLIESEWRMFQQRVRNGEIYSLPTASTTKAIHIRPHAQTGADVDAAVLAGKLRIKTKQSFWLNQDFVASLVVSET